MTTTKETLLKKLNDRTAKVGVMGLGYVGLPLIQAYIRAGFTAIGYDVDAKKVDSLNAGSSYIEHIPSQWISDWVKSGKFSATSDMNRLSDADAILICVPTPLNESRDPDLYYVEESVKLIAKTLRKGQLVVLESTTYPGTTRDVMLPILDKAGLTVGEDYFLAYSPEREDPGNADYSSAGIPKLVGGYDAASAEVAVALYEKAIVKIIPVSSCEVAEAAKVVENTYRSVNIAMVNELKIIFDKMGIDVWEVINAAKTKPFGFQAFFPGPGLGGHCIPIDPFYLSWVARKYSLQTRFIELAGEINIGMPKWVVQKVLFALNKQKKALNGSRILILGLAYKPDVDDCRESPSFVLWEQLESYGAKVDYHDPHCPSAPKMREHPQFAGIKSVAISPEVIKQYDCVLIATDHKKVDYKMVVENAKIIVDSRNAIEKFFGASDKVVKA
ncbi:MAG: nucleotide sugar dehydrogenase [Planctomycetaceae bacterium]|jgi:UDP-N-acetyl-D-glucosamine dehydrogenase|nr:nucleotide sugar dehydrogenase [Planctomycetaceae bacterium]